MVAYKHRQQKIYSYLREEGLDIAVLVDLEGRRNPSLRYLTGYPADALLFLSSWGECFLIPWDENLAAELASVDKIIPYNSYKRTFSMAVQSLAEEWELKAGSRIELSGKFPYPVMAELETVLPDMEIICSYQGLDSLLLELRSIKDESEIQAMQKACEISNEIIQGIEELLADKRGSLRELDIAQYIDSEARTRGAEGTGFETLAAAANRSFAIHAFPSYGSGLIGERGFSVIDFGVKYRGYTSDVTITVIHGPLSKLQQKMVEAVSEIYELALSLIDNGIPTREIALRIDEAFAKWGFKMPHALGHGIGLAAHEAPFLRMEDQNSSVVLQEGMIFTVEPGLYYPEAGGIRLENDILMTTNGLKVMTNSRIIEI